MVPQDYSSNTQSSLGSHFANTSRSENMNLAGANRKIAGENMIKGTSATGMLVHTVTITVLS